MSIPVTVKGLSAGYGGKPVLEELSFDLQKGEIIALIGPNGAGKSTLLKALARQLLPMAGVIELDGRDLAAFSGRELARTMSLLLTDRVRPELMTCEEVVSAGRIPYTGRFGILSEGDRTAVREAMETVHVLDLADRPFTGLSDGQRQRVLLARALAQEPDILILDEPTSFLDIRHKVELLSILRHLARDRGISILMTLHEIDLAQKAADRLIAVKDGRIFGIGTPEELFDAPRIQELYSLPSPCYDPLFGSLELSAAAGEPEVFVLSDSGRGIPVYRRLQRAMIPFAAGILYPGDLDAHLARQLASRVILAPAFEPIPDSALNEAADLIRQTRKTICAGVTLGSQNRRISELIQLAKDLGKYEDASGT